MFRLLLALLNTTCSFSNGLELGVQLKLLFCEEGMDRHPLPGEEIHGDDELKQSHGEEAHLGYHTHLQRHLCPRS